MKSFKQFNEAGYTDRFAHQSVEDDSTAIFDIANPDSLKKVNAYVGAIADKEINPTNFDKTMERLNTMKKQEIKND